jgi:hypothetical protein
MAEQEDAVRWGYGIDNTATLRTFRSAATPHRERERERSPRSSEAEEGCRVSSQSVPESLQFAAAGRVPRS